MFKLILAPLSWKWGGLLFSLSQMEFKGKYVAFEPQEQAHENLKQLGGNGESKTFNLQEAVKYKDSVDLVVKSHSFEHFNPGKIEEILRGVVIMLRTCGCYFCEVPNANLSLYPNAGEMVVPHLSFFTIHALQSFFTKAGMDLKFLNACGDSQLEKDAQKQINELSRKGYFVFDLDQDNRILRNHKYQEYLDNEHSKQRKRECLIKLANTLFGNKIVLQFIDFIRKFRQKTYHSLLATNYFLYGTDREYLSLITIK
jgi:hypothetical protein